MANNIFQNQKEIDEFSKEWDQVTNSLKNNGMKVKVEVDVPSIGQIIGEKVDSITELINTQRKNCIDKYNIGIYNGLVLARSVLTGEEPKYYEMEDIKNE